MHAHTHAPTPLHAYERALGKALRHSKQRYMDQREEFVIHWLTSRLQFMIDAGLDDDKVCACMNAYMFSYVCVYEDTYPRYELQKPVIFSSKVTA